MPKRHMYVIKNKCKEIFLEIPCDSHYSSCILSHKIRLIIIINIKFRGKSYLCRIFFHRIGTERVLLYILQVESRNETFIITLNICIMINSHTEYSISYC